MYCLRIIIIFVALALRSCSLGAQEIPSPYLVSATSAPSALTYFNFDVDDSMYADVSANHRIIFRDLSENVWGYGAMQLLYQACSTFTFSGSIEYQPPSQLLEWYFRSENDTAVVSQSPKNTGDIFPAPAYLMADMGADPVGDAGGGAGSYLDVTHLYASYSDTRLYFQFQNNGGGYPTNQGLFTYFIYSVGIVDPNTTDSAAYVLVYANVPALFSPGLYLLDAADSSFTQIASISYQISGNNLYMSCNIADLTAQPGWSDWPPPAGFIGLAPVTATAVLTSLTTNDFGKSGVFIPLSRQLDFGALNNAPQLSAAAVSIAGEDTLSFEVTYTDPDNHLPVVRNLVVESEAHPMSSCLKGYQEGAAFEKALTVSATGWYRYYFEFSDGLAIVSTPLDSIYIELPSYICGDANADEAINVSDAVYIINFVFVGGTIPEPLEAADANCDSAVNISDAVWIINFVFIGTNLPCDLDGDGIADC